jgi:predicted peptidase
MRHAHALPVSLLFLIFGLQLPASEPSVAANGWSNIPGMLEGAISTRPVDTTLPRPPLGYLEYLPAGYDPADATTSWPLVVFISGLGEVGDGTDTEANGHQLYVNMVRHGPFRQMTAAQWDFPAIVVAVQQPGYWNNATILLPVFEYLKTRYRVDSKRMHLTGLCDGAVGVLNFASQHPGYLAGIMPIEGGSDPTPGMAARLALQPMWAVHCFNDTDIARTSTVLWVDQAALAMDAAAVPVMSTYPAYPGNPSHMAVDRDPATGRPLDPFGPTMIVPAASLTAGSTEITFGLTVFGSAMFNSWDGSDAWPYALVQTGAPPDRGAKAGVMFRDSAAPGAMHVMVAQGPNNEVFMSWRGATDGASGSGARSGGRAGVKWVRLARSGTTYTGSYSLDGLEWTGLGSRTMAFSGSSCLGGLAVTAHNDATTWTQSFAGLSLAGSLVGADIGSPGRAGSATLADGVWTLVGGGSDIWNTADQFHYASIAVPGDETITARIGTEAEPQVIALGKPDRVFLTRPYAGPTTVRDLYIQLPVGFNNTAYFDATTHAWVWQRNQVWDQARTGRHIFTMTWYKNHVQGWVDTYSNGGCWDWLFSQSQPTAPAIIAQPQDIAVVEGGAVTFTASATGTAPMSWQWLRDGVTVVGATAASWTIDPTALADGGAHVAVAIANVAGTVISQPALLTIIPLPPVIIVQPQGQSVPDGQAATFSVVVGGAGPLGWQWSRDGVAIAGANAGSYTTVMNTMAASGGRYAVAVRNPGGEVVSASAVLTVTAAAPVVTVQPADATVTVGQSAIFSITASGTPVLGLQWQRSAPAGGGWSDLAGAVSPSYRTVVAVLAEDGARFRCLVRNNVGAATSEPAMLTVVVAPPASGGSGDAGGGGGGGGCGTGMAAAGVLAGLALLGLGVRARRSTARATLLLLGTALAASEPTVARNGWSNIPGIIEGLVITRPVDTTQPRPPLGFVEYLPKGYAPGNGDVRWPLLVMCTGIGERGDGTDTIANGHQLYANMVKHGPLHQVVQARWDFPGIIIVPQQPGYWRDANVLKQVFEWAKANRRVDADRLYLTGLCDGASGLLTFAAANPGYLAGILPIEASSAPKDGMAAAIRDLPMWAVHCFNDPSIARTSSVAWVDQAALADFGASNVMSTYPGFAGKPYHAAVDCDPLSSLPLDPFGPVTPIPLGSLTAGSTWIGFGATTFGSAAFNSWGGTDSLPYAQVRRGWAPSGGGAPADPSVGVVSVGKPTGLYLTRPCSDASGTTRLYIQIPVGYNATATAELPSGAWTWRRGQSWDRGVPGRRLFTMCWYQDHVQGWLDTYANGDCWDWLFSQALPSVLPPAEPVLAINGWSNRAAVVEGSILVRPVDTTLPRPPYGHLVYLPAGYEGIAAWPLVVHLGGAGEAGDGTDSAANGHQLYNQMVRTGALRQVVARQWDFPAIIVAPQVTTNWAKPANVRNVIAYAKATYHVDPDRIYLTGALEGANGALRFAVAHPGEPAALLTIEAGIPASAAQAVAIRILPLWAAHGFADPGVARGNSIGWIDALAAASSGIASDAMATHPGYGGDRNHFAVDSDPQTGRPSDPNGESFGIPAAMQVPGSATITFAGGSFGSSVFGMWGGSEALPFAQVVLAGGAGTSARGYPASLTLTAPYAGIAMTSAIAVRTPVGYDVTAFRAATGMWVWHRGQPWTPAQPDQQVLSLFWRQSAADAWTRTWDAVEAWNWLFNQVRAPAGSS